MPWSPTPRCVDCRRRPRVSGRRCRPCAQAYEARRGSRQERGYDAGYERERRATLRDATHCRRCGKPFTAADPATAGHVVPRSKGGGTEGNLAPEHASCNYAAGNRR